MLTDSITCPSVTVGAPPQTRKLCSFSWDCGQHSEVSDNQWDVPRRCTPNAIYRRQGHHSFRGICVCSSSLAATSSSLTANTGSRLKTDYPSSDSRNLRHSAEDASSHARLYNVHQFCCLYVVSNDWWPSLRHDCESLSDLSLQWSHQSGTTDNWRSRPSL